MSSASFVNKFSSMGISDRAPLYNPNPHSVASQLDAMNNLNGTIGTNCPENSLERKQEDDDMLSMDTFADLAKSCLSAGSVDETATWMVRKIDHLRSKIYDQEQRRNQKAGIVQYLMEQKSAIETQIEDQITERERVDNASHRTNHAMLRNRHFKDVAVVVNAIREEELLQSKLSDDISSLLKEAKDLFCKNQDTAEAATMDEPMPQGYFYDDTEETTANFPFFLILMAAGALVLSLWS